jgi:hypothetical protein
MSSCPPHADPPGEQDDKSRKYLFSVPLREVKNER